MSSSDNFYQLEIGPRSGPTKGWSWYGSKLFDWHSDVFNSWMIFLDKVDFEKKKKYPVAIYRIWQKADSIFKFCFPL